MSPNKEEARARDELGGLRTTNNEDKSMIEPYRSTANAETIAEALGGAKRNGSGWVAICPAHDDHNPSLSLTNGDGGWVLWHCFAGCSQEAVTAELKARDLIGGNYGVGTVPACIVRHEYREATGELKLTVIRKLGPNGKTKRKPGGKGKEITREPRGVRRTLPALQPVRGDRCGPEKTDPCL